MKWGGGASNGAVYEGGGGGGALTGAVYGGGGGGGLKWSCV